MPDAAPRYAGYVAWRGTVPEADLDAGVAAGLADAITYHVGANTHILVYPIPGPGGEVEPGRRLVNVVRGVRAVRFTLSDGEGGARLRGEVIRDEEG